MKQIFLMLMLGFGHFSTQAQITFKPGVITSVFGSFDVGNPEQGFSPIVNPMFAVNVSKGEAKLGLNSLYSMRTNSFGGAVYYNIHQSYGAYLLGFKSTQKNQGFLALGVYHPVWEAKASIFLDIGTPLPRNKLFLEYGVFFLLFK